MLFDIPPERRKDFENALLEVWWDMTKFGKVEPISVEESAETLHDTSAGYSFRGKSKHEVLDLIVEKAYGMTCDIRDGKKLPPTPCTLGTRGSLHLKEERKGRLIFVYPSEITVLEQMFVHPIYEMLKKEKDSPLYFGPNTIARLSRDSQRNFPNGSHSITVDFRTFDINVIIAMIYAAFDIIYEMIDFTHYKGKKISKAATLRWERVFSFLREYFCHTPVMTPTGRLIWIDGAVPSGSGFTQLVDSIVAMIATRFLANTTCNAVLDLKSLGDDVRAVLAGRPRLEVWEELMLKSFKMEINTKKTKVKSAKVLGSGFLGYEFKNGYLYRDSSLSFSAFSLAATIRALKPGKALFHSESTKRL